MSFQSSGRIIGIDPGFGRMGYGVVEKQKGEWVHVAHGCIETDTKAPFARRLLGLRQGIRALVKKYAPEIAAVEELFFNKNVTTAIQVGQARGVILVTLEELGLEVHECTPLQIKQAMTGYGRAEKGQVQKMLGFLLKFGDKKIQDDAADALAAALTVGATLSFHKKTSSGAGK